MSKETLHYRYNIMCRRQDLLESFKAFTWRGHPEDGVSRALTEARENDIPVKYAYAIKADDQYAVAFCYRKQY